MADEIGWFVGIDWASESHQVCLLDASGKCLGERSVRYGGAGLAEACDWLAAKTTAAPASIAVAIEVPHGPVVEALFERGFQVCAVNPKQLDRFRDRFSAAGTKDDRRDAHVLADALRTDREALRCLSPDDPLVIELREWSRMTEDLQQERNRLTNRLREQLWRYYPQMLEFGGDLAAAWILELWRLAPTPAKAAMLVIQGDGHGEIGFGALQAGLDLEYDRSIVFCTWAGFDEMDEVTGSGSAELLEDGTLEIEFVYHLGDEAVLRAKRATSSVAC